MMEHRIKVTEVYGQRSAGSGERGIAPARSQAVGNPHGDKTLDAIADQGERGRRLVAGAQHVGRPGIARAVTVRIGQAEHLAHDDGERHRAQQVRGDDHDERRHTGVLHLDYNARAF